jgi:hypothetical protein
MQGYHPQSGDIAACYGRDLSSLAIRARTYWPLSPSGLRLGPSHVAILAPGPSIHGPEPLWYESTTMCSRDCLMRGEPVSGVQVHDWGDRASDYTSRRGRVVIYRLSPGESLTEQEQRQLQLMLVDMIADQIEYDMRGALTSGTVVWKWLSNQFGRHVGSLFCSDKIALLLMRLSRLKRGNTNYYTPAGLLRELVRNGVYQRHCVIDRRGVRA